MQFCIDEIEKKFLNFINKYNLIHKNDSILISFSGGPDSKFLLYLLNKVKHDYNLHLYLFHLNHLLRKEESLRDELFCKDIAQKYNIPLFLQRIDIKKYAKENKLNLEESGRFWRYKLLDEISKQKKIKKIATGHNLNDQVETFFMNISRGKSLLSLEGIKLERNNIIRPILIFSKKEILQFLKQNNLNFVTDSSNTDNKFLRNKFRNIIYPNLKKYLPDNFEKNILNISFQISLINDFISSIIEKTLIVKKSFLEIKIEKLIELPQFIRFECYKKALIMLGIKNYTKIFLNRIDNLFLNSQTTGIINSHKIVIYKEYDKLTFQKNQIPTFLNNITINNLTQENKYIKFKLINEPDFSKKTKYIEFFDYNNLKFPLKIRNFENGDKFKPLGMKNYLKLKNFFINKKIPRRIRKEIPLIVDNENEIIWIVGYQISDKVKIKKSSKVIVKAEFLLQNYIE